MEVFSVNHEGGYEKYAYNIKKHMSKVFPHVKSAYVYFLADSLENARTKAKNLFKEKEIKNNLYNFDNGEVKIEFENGHKVSIGAMEYGWIQLIKD